MSQIARSAFPRLSLIIPARNEAKRLPRSLEKIAGFLATKPYHVEIIVVDNGSTDATADVVREFARQHSDLRVDLIHEPRRGKGAAVQSGMLHGMGDTLFLCDADLSMPIDELDRFLVDQSSATDIAIGCREGIRAVRLNEPFHRHLMGRLFNFLVQSLALPGIPDSQCGFKAFRREVAHDLFRMQTIDGWGFDVEILAIARLRGYSVASIPITWQYDSDSRVRPFWDSICMLRETWRIRQQMLRGLYGRQIK